MMTKFKPKGGYYKRMYFIVIKSGLKPGATISLNPPHIITEENAEKLAEKNKSPDAQAEKEPTKSKSKQGQVQAQNTLKKN